jgi:NADH-quinone oxidoreductase subunit C
MTAREMTVRVEQATPWCEVEERYGNQLEIRSGAHELVTTLSLLKGMGFAHLVNIACTDWIDRGQFELIYNLWSYIDKVHATVKVTLNRNEPIAPTALSLWPHAQVYEREVHEFFGVTFTGNPDLRPFFLHNWHDIPPLRKDFDTQEYSRRAYGFLEDEERPESTEQREEAQRE